jgi:hypothetical protein
MTSRTIKSSAGNNRAAYMTEYRKRKRLEDNCNNVPKRTKLHAEGQREYRETHNNLYVEYMRNYRQLKRLNCWPTAILVRFPGYVLYIPYLEEGQIYFI